MVVLQPADVDQNEIDGSSARSALPWRGEASTQASRPSEKGASPRLINGGIHLMRQTSFFGNAALECRRLTSIEMLPW